MCHIDGIGPVDVDWVRTIYGKAFAAGHVDDWALSRRTTLQHRAWLCLHHHRLKTHRRFTLAGPPCNRTWTPTYVRASPVRAGGP